MVSDRPIVFLSDYGLEDEFVGICHAVMTRISPHDEHDANAPIK